MDRYGFLKTAAAIPSVRVADCAYNGERIAALVAEAAGRGVEVVLFPELSVTGYTCGDLFLQPALLAAAEQALAELLRRTAELNTAFVVGLPVAVDDMLYNCAVVAAAGEVLGVVPKCHIPDYAEFYESRWFASGQGRRRSRSSCAGRVCRSDPTCCSTSAVRGARWRYARTCGCRPRRRRRRLRLVPR